MPNDTESYCEAAAYVRTTKVPHEHDGTRVEARSSTRRQCLQGRHKSNRKFKPKVQIGIHIWFEHLNIRATAMRPPPEPTAGHPAVPPPTRESRDGDGESTSSHRGPVPRR